MVYNGKHFVIRQPSPRSDNPLMRTIFDHNTFKASLKKKMFERGLFWSYDIHSLNSITDEELVSTAYTHGDLKELTALLYLFPLLQLKSIWSKTFKKETHLKREGEFVSIFLFNESTKL